MRVRKVTEKEYPQLSSQIKDARYKDSRSLKKIVEAAGTTEQHWRRIEEGFAKSMPLETVRNIENALGINLGVDL